MTLRAVQGLVISAMLEARMVGSVMAKILPSGAVIGTIVVVTAAGAAVVVGAAVDGCNVVVAAVGAGVGAAVVVTGEAVVATGCAVVFAGDVGGAVVALLEALVDAVGASVELGVATEGAAVAFEEEFALGALVIFWQSTCSGAPKNKTNARLMINMLLRFAMESWGLAKALALRWPVILATFYRLSMVNNKRMRKGYLGYATPAGDVCNPYLVEGAARHRLKDTTRRKPPHRGNKTEI
jgi:hypothetical protein